MNTLNTNEVYNNGIFCRQKTLGVGEFFRAIKKHPLFPEHLTWLSKESVNLQVAQIQEVNETVGSASAHTIFAEELYEFFQAVQRGDLEAARIELAQCHAVLHRFGQHLETYVKKEVAP